MFLKQDNVHVGESLPGLFCCLTSLHSNIFFPISLELITTRSVLSVLLSSSSRLKALNICQTINR